MSRSEAITTAVHIKDLVERLDGETLREVADLELKIQGWQWCDMEELADHQTRRQVVWRTVRLA